MCNVNIEIFDIFIVCHSVVGDCNQPLTTACLCSSAMFGWWIICAQGPLCLIVLNGHEC